MNVSQTLCARCLGQPRCALSNGDTAAQRGDGGPDWFASIALSAYAVLTQRGRSSGLCAGVTHVCDCTLNGYPSMHLRRRWQGSVTARRRRGPPSCNRRRSRRRSRRCSRRCHLFMLGLVRLVGMRQRKTARETNMETKMETEMHGGAFRTSNRACRPVVSVLTILCLMKRRSMHHSMTRSVRVFWAACTMPWTTTLRVI